MANFKLLKRDSREANFKILSKTNLVNNFFYLFLKTFFSLKSARVNAPLVVKLSRVSRYFLGVFTYFAQSGRRRPVENLSVADVDQENVRMVDVDQ